MAKKKIPNNWMGNAVKSLGISSIGVLNEYSPTSGNIAKTGSTMGKSAHDFLKNRDPKKVSKLINGNEAVKFGKEFFKNAAEDLKSGKFVNKERSEKAFDEAMGLSDMESMFDDFDIDFDDSLDDVTIEGDVNVNNVDLSEVTDSIKAQTSVQQKSSQALNSSVIAAMGVMGDNYNKGTSEVLSVLNNIDSNIAEMVRFQNESMGEYIRASINFYGHQIEATEESYKASKNDIYSSAMNNGFSLTGYKDAVKKNIQTTYKGSMVGTFGDLLLQPEMRSLFTSSPLSFLASGAIKSATPRLMKETLKDFDATLTDFIPTVLNRISDMAGDSNYYKSMFGKVFGIKFDRKRDINLARNLEEKAVPFDSITKHTIVDVIPTYLRKIADAVTGEDLSFNWNTGRFQSTDTIRRETYGMMKDEVTNSFYGSKFHNKMTDYTRGGKLNEKDREQFDEILERLYLGLERSGKEFNPIKNGAEGSLGEIFGYNGKGKLNISDKYNENIIKYFEASIASMTPEDIMNLTKHQQRARRNSKDMKKMMEENQRFYNLHTLNSDSEDSDAVIDSLFYDKAEERFISPPPASNVTSIDRTKISRGGKKTTKKTRNRNTRRRQNRGSLDDAAAGSVDYEVPEPSFIRPDASKAERLLGSYGFDGSIGNSNIVSNLSVDEMAKIFRDNTEEYGPSSYERGFGKGVRKGLTPVVKPATDRIENVRKAMISFLYGDTDQMFNNITDVVVDKVAKVTVKFQETFLDPIKVALFGTKNETGFVEGGMFAGVQNKMKDSMLSFMHVLSGKGYTNSKGQEVDDEDNPEKTVWGNVKNVFKTIKTSTTSYLFGNKNKDVKLDKEGNPIGTTSKGILSSALDSLNKGFQHLTFTFFGDPDAEASDKNKAELVEEFKKKLKERAPKTLAGAVVGGMGGAVFGGGLMGTLLGGPIFGASLGAATGWLSQSDKFKDWFLGKQDPDTQERAGGIISKKTQDFFSKNGNSMIAGATLGTIKGMLFPGSGILGTILGGPLAGAALGAGFSILKNTKMFQEFLYGAGVEGEDGYKKGIVTKFKGLFKNKDDQNRLGIGAAGAISGAGIASVVGQMGLMGAMLTPMGPLGGAIVGAAVGIASSSDKFRTMLFGEKDETTGKRDGGVISKVQQFMQHEVFQPVKDEMAEIAFNVKWYLKDKILAPVSDAIDPLVYEFKNMVSTIKEKVTATFTSVKESVKDMVTPIVEDLHQKVVIPLVSTVKNLTNKFFGVIGSIVASPFKLLSSIALGLSSKHENQVVRDASTAAFDNTMANRNKGVLGYFGGLAKATYSAARVGIVGRNEAIENSGTYLAGYAQRRADRDNRNNQDREFERSQLNQRRMESRLAQAQYRYNAAQNSYVEIDLSGLRGDERRKAKQKNKRAKARLKREEKNLNAILKKMGRATITSAGAESVSISDNDPLDREPSQSVAAAVVSPNSDAVPSAIESVNNARNSILRNIGGRRLSRNSGVQSDQEMVDSTVDENGQPVSRLNGIRRRLFGGNTSNPASAIVDGGSASTRTSGRYSATELRTKADNATIEMAKDVNSIKDSVKGQLNGVGINISRIRRMIGKASGLSADENDDLGSDNNEYVSFKDKIFNFLDAPFRRIGLGISKVTTGIVNGAKSVHKFFSDTWEKVKSIPAAIFRGFKKVGSAIISGIGSLTKASLQLLGDGLRGLGSIIGGAASAIGAATKGLVVGTATLIGSGLKALGSGLSALVAGIPKFLENTANAATAIVSFVGTGLEKTVTVLGSLAVSTMKVIGGIGSGILKGIKAAGKAALELFAVPFKLIGAGIGKVSDKIRGRSEINKLKSLSGGWIDRIVEPVKIDTDKPIRVIVTGTEKTLPIEFGEKNDNNVLQRILSSLESLPGTIANVVLHTGSNLTDNNFANIAAGVASATGAINLAQRSKRRKLGKTSGSSMSDILMSAIGGDSVDPTADDKKRHEAQAAVSNLTEKNIVAKKNAEMEELTDDQRDDERNSLLRNLVLNVSKHNSKWDSIFSKKGLITAGLLLALPFAKKIWNGLKGVLGWLSGHMGKSGDNENGDTAIERVEDNVTDLKKGLWRWIFPDSDNDGHGEVDHMTGAKVNTLYHSKGYLKHAAKKNKVAKAVNGGLDKAGAAIKKHANKIPGVKTVTTKGDEIIATMSKKKKSIFDKVVQCIEKLGETLVSGLDARSGKISREYINQFSKKELPTVVEKAFPKILSALGKHVAAAAESAGISEIAFAIGTSINYMSAPARLFQVDKKYVDFEMTAIAGKLGSLIGTTIGSIVDIVNSYTADIFGFNFIHELACAIYKTIADDEGDLMLDKGESVLRSEYETYKNKTLDTQRKAYNRKNGTNVKLDDYKQMIADNKVNAKYDSFEDFNYKTNRTWATKAWDAVNSTKAGRFITSSVSKAVPMSINTMIDTNPMFAPIKGVKTVGSMAIHGNWSDKASSISKAMNNFGSSIDEKGLVKTVDNYMGATFGFRDDDGTPLSLVDAMSKDWAKSDSRKVIGNLSSTVSKFFGNMGKSIAAFFKKYSFKNIKSSFDNWVGSVFGFTDKKGNVLSLSKWLTANKKTNKASSSDVGGVNIQSSSAYGSGDYGSGDYGSGDYGGKTPISTLTPNQKFLLESQLGKKTSPSRTPLIMGKQPTITTSGVANPFTQTAWMDKKVKKAQIKNGVNPDSKDYMAKTISDAEVDAALTENSEGNNVISGLSEAELANNAAYYSQTDPEWKGTALGNSTIGKIGCIVSSLAMQVSSLARKRITPKDVVENYGSYFGKDGGIKWNLFEKIAQDNNLISNSNGIKGKANILNTLKNNIPVVMYGAKSSSGNLYGKRRLLGGSNQNHAVLAVGTTSDGKLLINDPGNPSHTTQALDSDSMSSLKRAVPMTNGDGTGIKPGLTFDSTASSTTVERKYNNVLEWFGDVFGELASRTFTSAITGEEMNTDYSDFDYDKIITTPGQELSTDGAAVAITGKTLKDEIINKLAYVTSSLESSGKYDAVNANDNGSYSVGKIQFHKGNAKTLFDSIAARLTDKKLKAKALAYSKASNRPLTASEARGMGNFLNNASVSAINKDVQDVMSRNLYASNIRVPWDMYSKGIIKDPRSVILAGDIANSGPGNMLDWRERFKGTSSKAKDLNNTRRSLTSNESYWGRAKTSKYYKGWMNRINKAYGMIDGMVMTHGNSSTGDYGSGDDISSLLSGYSPNRTSKASIGTKSYNDDFLTNYNVSTNVTNTQKTNTNSNLADFATGVLKLLSAIAGNTLDTTKAIDGIDAGTLSSTTTNNYNTVNSANNNAQSTSNTTMSKQERQARLIATSL